MYTGQLHQLKKSPKARAVHRHACMGEQDLLTLLLAQLHESAGFCLEVAMASMKENAGDCKVEHPGFES